MEQQGLYKLIKVKCRTDEDNRIINQYNDTGEDRTRTEIQAHDKMAL